MLWWWKRKLQNEDPATRKRALQNIASYGERGRSLIVAATDDPDADVCTCAVEQLGWLTAAREVEPLVERFGAQAYPEEFLTIIKAVWVRYKLLCWP